MQRQKSASKPQNGEQRRRRRSADEEKRAPPGSGPHAPLCVSLLCLSVTLFIAWLHLQQSAELADITQKYERVSGQSRRLRELEDEISAVSRQLQASSSSSSSSVSVVLGSWAEQWAEQQGSELLLQALAERVRGVRAALRSEELEQLRNRSRAARSSTTQRLNEAEALLRELGQRLGEVRDGTGRNGRALERSEEEDARRLQELLDWSESTEAWALRRLTRLDQQGLELRRRLDTLAPQHTHLPQAKDAVRSMLRLRAQLSATYRHLDALQQQVHSAEEHASS